MPKIVAGIEFPDDATPAEIREVLAQEGIEAAPESGRDWLGDVLRHGQRFGQEFTVKTLPMASSIAGGFAGPWGIPVGAAVGSLAAEPLAEAWGVEPHRPLVNELLPPEAQNPATRAVGNAVDQSGAALVGGLLSAAARGVAPHVMRHGLKAKPTTEAVAARPIRAGEKEDPMRLARTALEHRLTSAGKADKAVEASSSASAAKRAAAAARGARVPIHEIAEDLERRAAASLGRPLTRRERGELLVEVRQRANELLAAERMTRKAGRQSTFSPDEAHQIKQAAQARARGSYEAKAVGRRPPLSQRDDKLLASGSRRALNRVAGTEADDALTSRLIAVRDALRTQQAQGHPTAIQWGFGFAPLAGGVAAGRPVEGLASGLAGGLLTHPAVMRRVAVAMDDPLINYLLAQSPRLATFGADLTAEEAR